MSYLDKRDNEVYHSFEPKEEEFFFEVDENIAYVISQLRKKGYETSFCCEGHYEKLNRYGVSQIVTDMHDAIVDATAFMAIPTYIAFADGVKLPFKPKDFTLTIEDETLDKNDNLVKGYFVSLHALPPEKNLNEAQLLFKKFDDLKELVYWVDALPVYVPNFAPIDK